MIMNQNGLKYLGIGLMVFVMPIALLAEELKTAQNPYPFLSAASSEMTNTKQITGKTASGDSETTIVDENGNLKMVPQGSQSSGDNRNEQNGLERNIVNQDNTQASPPTATPMPSGGTANGMSSSSPGRSVPAPSPSLPSPSTEAAGMQGVTGTKPLMPITPSPSPNLPAGGMPLAPPSPLTPQAPAAPLTPQAPAAPLTPQSPAAPPAQITPSQNMVPP